MRGVVRCFSRHCISLSFWQLVQLVVFISYVSAQYVLHVQLSTRLNEALARLDKLEQWMKNERHGKVQTETFDMKQGPDHSRGKRHSEEGRLNKLWERIESLDSRIAVACNFNSSDPGAFCVQGPPGRNGIPGKNGIPGRDGKDGVPGRDGRDGADGRDGIPGRNGISGRQGLPGRDGATGPKGEQGHRGHRGKPGPQGPPGDVVISQKDYVAKGTNQETSGSTVYVRWGNIDCRRNKGTALVYKGRVAGWRPTQQEGGSHYLCMPPNPLYMYNSPTPGNTDPKASLFGVRYGPVEKLFEKLPGRGPRINYQGVPCAVCRVERRGSLMMIPARNVCPTRQWTREYHGYLMTDISNSTKPEYICVDADVVSVGVRNSETHPDKGLLTSVQGKCGTLPCPPYQEDRELTCAVCTM